MKKGIIFSFLFIFSLFFIYDVKAANLPIYVHNLEYNNWSLLNGNWNSFVLGNRNINFGYMVDSSLSDMWVYNSLVICSDTTFQGGIIPSAYNGYIRNISYNHTPYSCSYSCSSGTSSYRRNGSGYPRPRHPCTTTPSSPFRRLLPAPWGESPRFYSWR